MKFLQSSRELYPSFVTHPNYHDGQFQFYYPPETPNPISQPPTTSASTTTHYARMNYLTKKHQQWNNLNYKNNFNIKFQYSSNNWQKKHTDLILCLLL